MKKIWTGGDARRSRIHTRRGDRIPLSDAAGALGRRFGRVSPRGPWLAPSAVRALEALIEKDWVVLELGAGISTSWLAERVAAVISVEHDPEWRDVVARRVSDAGLRNVRLVLPDAATLGADPVAVGEVDAVIIDFTDTPQWTRLDSVGHVSRLERPSLVVLDDSDRIGYAGADDLMASWQRTRFVGMRSRPLVATETTFYTRPR